MKLSTTFAALVSISAASAQTTTPDDDSMLLIQSLRLKDELPKPGYNTEGGSVFDNYVKALRDGQFFHVRNVFLQYEKPLSEPIEAKDLQWCSNLHFTGSSNSTFTRGVGYTAQCVSAKLGDAAEIYAQMNASGAELTHQQQADEYSSTKSLSASFNAQANMFNMVSHTNTDNYAMLYSDTGLSTMPLLAWEAHDEGDRASNADTSSWSMVGQVTWISTEEAARLLNINATDFNPEKFDEIYEKVWNDHHAYAAAQQTSTDTDTESSTSEEKEEESTDVDTDESSGGNDEDSVTTVDTIKEEPKSDTANEEGDESSANNGRRLFVAITSMFSTLLGSSV